MIAEKLISLSLAIDSTNYSHLTPFKMANRIHNNKFNALWDLISNGPYDLPEEMKSHIKIALDNACKSYANDIRSFEMIFDCFWNNVRDGPYDLPDDIKSHFKESFHKNYPEILLIGSLTFDQFSKLKVKSFEFKALPQPEKQSIPKPPACVSTDYTYVETDERLGRFLCPICIHPAVDPIAVQCCGEVHCKQCFTETFEKLSKSSNPPGSVELKRMPCVKCKVPLGIANQVRIAGGYKDFFDELTVTCGDCQQNHRRDQFANHWLHHCQTPCTNQCGQLLSRTEQIAHPNSCQMVKINCTHRGCKQSFLRQDDVDRLDHIKKCYHGQINEMSIEELSQLAIKQLVSQSIIPNVDAKVDLGAQLDEKKESEPIGLKST